jgi:hypothetical protein
MTHYVIKPGDTLSDIANEFGMTMDDIWQRNRGALDAAAQSRGYPSSNAGTLIFPGTTLNVGQPSWV